MKTCSKCGFEGDESLFMKETLICRECRKIYLKEWRKNNRELRLANDHRYYRKNKSKILRRKMVRGLRDNFRNKYDNIQEWGRKKSRDFMIGYGALSADQDEIADRNKSLAISEYQVERYR